MESQFRHSQRRQHGSCHIHQGKHSLDLWVAGNSGAGTGWKTTRPAMLRYIHLNINRLGKFKIYVCAIDLLLQHDPLIAYQQVPAAIQRPSWCRPVPELLCQTSDRPQVVEFLPDDGAPLVAPLSDGLPFGSVLSLEGTTPPGAQEWVFTPGSSESSEWF